MNRAPKFLETTFGGKKGFLRHCQALLALRAGRYRHWQEIDLAAVSRLVFVCSGNISRSPYSEFRAREQGLSSISFGLHAGDGNPAEDSAISNAANRGIDLDSHRSTPIGDYAPSTGDLVLAYEAGHAEALRIYCDTRGAHDTQVSLLGLWARPQHPLVFDPYGLHGDYYQTCYALIDSAVENLALMMETGVPESAL